VLLTTSEWIKIRDAAAKQFRNETLSRGEIFRRYVLCGIGILEECFASRSVKSRLAHQLQASMEASDERLKH
jgi:hypothetical protein